MLSLQAGFGRCKKSWGEIGHIAWIQAPFVRAIPGSNFAVDDARSQPWPYVRCFGLSDWWDGSREVPASSWSGFALHCFLAPWFKFMILLLLSVDSLFVFLACINALQLFLLQWWLCFSNGGGCALNLRANLQRPKIKLHGLWIFGHSSVTYLWSDWKLKCWILSSISLQKFPSLMPSCHLNCIQLKWAKLRIYIGATHPGRVHRTWLFNYHRAHRPRDWASLENLPIPWDQVPKQLDVAWGQHGERAEEPVLVVVCFKFDFKEEVSNDYISIPPEVPHSWQDWCPVGAWLPEG